MTALFVYGTLKRGMRNHGLVARWVRGVDVAVGPGRLFDVGLYPALVAGPGRVAGEVLHLDPAGAAEALALLDELEGYRPGDPAGSLYVRRPVTVEVADGRRVEAQTYLYTGPTDALREIGPGSWTGPSPASPTGDPTLDAFTEHVRMFAVRRGAAPGQGGDEEPTPP